VIAKNRFHRGPTSGPRGARQSLSKHVKYVQYRSLGPEENRDTRCIFDKEREGIARQQMVRDVLSRTCTRVNYHRMILSPAKDERVEDWQRWTRRVMADLEAKQGIELHWYAVQHSNTEYPHVHVVIAGTGEQRGSGQREPVVINETDFARLRESGREHSEYARDRVLAEQQQREQAEWQAERAEYEGLIVGLEQRLEGREDRDRRPDQAERERHRARAEQQQRREERGYDRGR